MHLVRGRIAVVDFFLRLAIQFVEPVVPGVVIDDVQKNAHIPLMRIINEIAQVLPGPEAGIDFQEVLYTISMIGFQVLALFEYGRNP